jgi:steroid delta-isomerase-like uncharacterized protein
LCDTLADCEPGGDAVSTENSAIVRRFVDEYVNQKNDAALDALVADDFICYVGGVASTASEGRQVWARRSRTLRTAFPDFHITIDELLVDTDKVVMRYRGHGTHRGPFGAAPPTNKDVTYTGIAILRISNGKIAEEWTEYDSIGLMRQVQAIPTDAAS